jgi:flagellar basal-body rod modification protein FlgD
MSSALSGLSPINNVGLTTATATGSNKLGKDEFLKLLVAQLANQDPLAPTDNQQYIAQLAQFSSVEQAEGTNSRLDSLLMAQASGNQQSASNFIGKDVVYNTDQVSLGPSGGNIVGNLAGAAKSLTITITDAKGKVVDTIEREQVNAGNLVVPWSGRNKDGVQLPEGSYTVKIEAKDARGNAVTVSPRGQAHCTGVTFENGYPELILNGTPVKMSEIIKVIEPSTTALAAKAAVNSLKYSL